MSTAWALTVGAGADQPRADHRRPIGVQLLEAQLGVRLGKLVEPAGHAVDVGRDPAASAGRPGARRPARPASSPHPAGSRARAGSGPMTLGKSGGKNRTLSSLVTWSQRRRDRPQRGGQGEAGQDHEAGTADDEARDQTRTYQDWHSDAATRPVIGLRAIARRRAAPPVVAVPRRLGHPWRAAEHSRCRPRVSKEMARAAPAMPDVRPGSCMQNPGRSRAEIADSGTRHLPRGLRWPRNSGRSTHGR